ncbi:MAG: LysR family transcriptional regulator [Frankia sp.]
MDLDLAQLRAFIATAEELHFGRAAQRLFLTQQALSKRIARLEKVLGVELFSRRNRAVELTAAGRRFLEPARQTLTAGDLAVAAARDNDRPLRIDLWGHLYSPMRTVRQVLDDFPHLDVELGWSRDLPAGITALSRGEIDAGFGRVYPFGGRRDGILHRLVRLERVEAVLGADHPLSGARELRPAELRDSRLWFPADFGRLDFLRRFADRFEIPVASGGANLGIDHFLSRLRNDPRCFSLYPAAVALPEAAGIRQIPLVGPTPLYGWSMVWRQGDERASLAALLRDFFAATARHGWLDYDPARDWLPDADHAELQRRSASGRSASRDQ